MLDIGKSHSNLLLFGLGKQASLEQVCHVLDFKIFELDAMDRWGILLHACDLLGQEDAKVAEGFQIRACMSEYGLLTQLTDGQDVLKTGLHCLDPAISHLETILERAITLLLAEIEIFDKLSFEHLYTLWLSCVIDKS